MVVDTATPYEGVPVGVRLQFGPVYEQLLQRHQPLLFQTPQKLVMQILQNLGGEPAAFEFIERIPFRLLSLGEPDESKVPSAQLNDAVHCTDPPHVGIGDYSVQHDGIVPFSSLV